jgi:hypothetical protein
MSTMSTAQTKSVPVALQGAVWPNRDGVMFPISELGPDRAAQALAWAERNLADLFAGASESMSDEAREQAESNLMDWWMTTPLYRALQVEAFGHPDVGVGANGSHPAPAPAPSDDDAEERLAAMRAELEESVERFRIRAEEAEAAAQAAAAPAEVADIDSALSRIPLSELPRWPATLAGLSAIIVALSAAAISLVAQKDVALEAQATYGWLAWLYPAVVDGGILASSAAIWAWQMEGRSTRRPRLAYGMAGSLLIVSAIVNVAHAGDDPLGKFMAALPPFVLLGSVELAAHLKQRRLAIAAAERLRAARVERNVT